MVVVEEECNLVSEIKLIQGSTFSNHKYSVLFWHILLLRETQQFSKPRYIEISLGIVQCPHQSLCKFSNFTITHYFHYILVKKIKSVIPFVNCRLKENWTVDAFPISESCIYCVLYFKFSILSHKSPIKHTCNMSLLLLKYIQKWILCSCVVVQK